MPTGLPVTIQYFRQLRQAVVLAEWVQMVQVFPKAVAVVVHFMLAERPELAQQIKDLQAAVVVAAEVDQAQAAAVELGPLETIDQDRQAAQAARG